MHSIPAPRDPGEPHPTWCARKHPGWPVHDCQVGVDLELSAGLAFAVGLQLVEGDTATQVALIVRTPGDASLTRFSLVEAAILRDLLSEALDLVRTAATDGAR